ncbi:ABC transporter ATP-binding protein [Diaminobutyricibacter sp. McL0608]|uniref:ABC transporter ATP-binding protein n=1 Tax=Leifsonia sp. McL0608 TaxID=3143537 RepID=UPI0031F30E3E
MNAATVSARDVRVVFPARQGGSPVVAVNGVDLDLNAGEIIALVGESGSGKTTLSRTLLGLERPAEGVVEYNGSALEYSTAALRRYRRQVQLVMQDPIGALNPKHSVYESVAEGIRIHNIVQRTNRAGGEVTETDLVARALARAGLRPPERFFLSYPHELSGGQCQRVLIAGALAVEPTVLVADEPVSSLDASIRGEILSLLLQLRDDLGLTVLVVTHDLGLAWNIADRIAVMYLGRIVEQGTTEEVLLSPKHPYTQALLSVVPEVEHKVPIVLRGEVPDPSRIPTGCSLNPRCPALLGGAAAKAGVASLCMQESPPSPAPGSGHHAACWLPTASELKTEVVALAGAPEFG